MAVERTEHVMGMPVTAHVRDRGFAAGDLDAAFAAMQELSARHFASAEGQEGMAAFAEKRPPAWVRDIR